ncbi:unnamed protein product [Parascedosporium putredinis]|uniref:Glycoside hydrolase family 5 domain-containing protein n=1 Tax=Parascedosporium putredinis TaxID=1442378 RepID=A0A9P1H3Z0_9PEZI|nr:unnamed protein product [Parascedosporium putredinis]CAI7996227.1 unnamed protein product [Parascedosporium putredinis]
MKFMKSLLATASLLLASASALPNVDRRQEEGPAAPAAGSWPDGPFKVEGRWVLNASGKNVTYAGINWSAHGEAMVPEGLQHQSIEHIVSMIKGAGVNAIRLTFAIEMIDDIYAKDGDTDLETSFIKALGEANGRKVLGQVLEKNPGFTAQTTRLEVFDAVAAECAKQQIYVHLDNHISKAKWCCGETDGNAWWGDREFPIDNWVRGLAYMAEHGKKWTALTSLALRNEPRNPSNNPAAAATYNWESWYKFVRQGSKAVFDANPDLLIFLSGLSYDTYIEPVFLGTALTPGNGRFSRDDFAGYADKLVLEIHNYERSIGSCQSLSGNLYKKGFQAMHPEDPGTVNVFPVMLTEFGYYIRSGTQEYDELWGFLTADFKDYRDPGYVNGAWKKMAEGVLAYLD